MILLVLVFSILLLLLLLFWHSVTVSSVYKSWNRIAQILCFIKASVNCPTTTIFSSSLCMRTTSFVDCSLTNSHAFLHISIIFLLCVASVRQPPVLCTIFSIGLSRGRRNISTDKMYARARSLVHPILSTV